MKSDHIDLNAKLVVERLGARGEGVSRTARGLVFTPYALAGETILAEVDGERGRLVEVLAPSPDRIASFCPHYGTCGGCAVQTLAEPAYLAWKRSLLVDALANAHVETDNGARIAPARDAHGAGRRRVVFHARTGAHGVELGFMQARAHRIVEISACPLLAPSMAGALAAARDIARVLSGNGKPLDIAVLATLDGLDVDLRGSGPLEFAISQKLIALAGEHDLARISNHGVIVIERRQPRIRIGRVDIVPPAGAFLQATEAGEAALAALVQEEIAGEKKIADLFSGLGTFALRLAEQAEVHAVEHDGPALAALSKAARNAQGLKRVTSEARDLFRRPLSRDELKTFEVVVFDPPRAGAEAQAREIAASAVPLAIAVSCNAQTFARDAKILVDGGYSLERATPVDQFRHSAHVEIVAAFRKAAPKTKTRRGLLSR